MAAPQIIQPVDSQSGWGLVPALDGNIGTATPDPATGVSATSTQQSATTTTQAVIQAQTVPPVPASVPMLDANGYISPAWSAYFQSLMRRIGGYADIPWEDLFILGEQDTPLPDSTARDMAQLSTLEVPQTPRQVDGDPFDAPRFPVAPDVDPFQIDRTVRVPDEDPFAGIIYPETRVFNASGAAHRVGLVPDPGVAAGVAKFLREDASWQVPPVFVASGASHAVGYVPDPGASAGTAKFLREDATWAAPSSGSLNYSTPEQSTGATWTDGKTVYQKTISLGTLPNAGNMNVAHGITGLSRVISFQGNATFGTSAFRPLPFVSTGTQSLEMSVNATNVQIFASGDWSPYTGFVTLFYTK